MKRHAPLANALRLCTLVGSRSSRTSGSLRCVYACDHHQPQGVLFTRSCVLRSCYSTTCWPGTYVVPTVSGPGSGRIAKRTTLFWLAPQDWFVAERMLGPLGLSASGRTRSMAIPTQRLGRCRARGMSPDSTTAQCAAHWHP